MTGTISNLQKRADALEEVADKMAQDLQEFIDAGEEAGSNMGASKGLLREYEAVKNNQPTWQTGMYVHTTRGNGEEPFSLLGLEEGLG